MTSSLLDLEKVWDTLASCSLQYGQMTECSSISRTKTSRHTMMQVNLFRTIQWQCGGFTWFRFYSSTYLRWTWLWQLLIPLIMMLWGRRRSMCIEIRLKSIWSLLNCSSIYHGLRQLKRSAQSLLHHSFKIKMTQLEVKQI